VEKERARRKKAAGQYGKGGNKVCMEAVREKGRKGGRKGGERQRKYLKKRGTTLR
jgi:hypothetical protein